MIGRKIKGSAAVAFSTLALTPSGALGNSTPKLENRYPVSSSGECLSETGNYTPFQLARVAEALQLFRFTRLEYCQEEPIGQPPVEAVGIYNPSTLKDEGNISVNGIFSVVCKNLDFKPTYMVVQELATSNSGAINIGADAQIMLEESVHVPACTAPLPAPPVVPVK
jgi:hypothetical protein